MRTTTTAIPTLRSPEHLLEAIPHLIGFHPCDALVAVVVRHSQVAVTAHEDLDAFEDPQAAAWLTERLTCDARGNPVDGTTVFLAAYGDRAKARSVLEDISDRLGRRVLDAIVVSHGQWCFLDEAGSTLGRPLPDPGPVSAAMGGPVVASRSALAQTMAAPVGAREDDLLTCFMACLDRVGDEDPRSAAEMVQDAMSRWAAGEVVSDEDFLCAGVAIGSGLVRDEIWKGMTLHTAKECLPFWVEVLSRTVTGLRTPILGVTGMVAWIAGEGAVMNICLEEAMSSDPEYPLIALLEQISRSCVPPQWWEEVMKPTGENPAQAVVG
ncbi:MAG: DUF4192 domain-containing protein [Propionibacteriaceae bacterium]|nr:DUF4192 domain-containing protein [Propionibacteriaceae bacterium]